MAGFTSEEIRELAESSHGPGNFQKLVFEILADMMETLEEIQYKQKYGHEKPK